MRRSRSSAALLALAACAGSPRAPVAPACDPRASITIARQADVARLAGCTAVANLTIRAGAPLDLAPLISLSEITGDLAIGPTVNLDDLTLAGVHTIGGNLRVVGNGLAQGLFLRALERAGQITIEGNPVLTTIALPHLTDATSLHVTDNPSLELLDLAALTIVDEVAIHGAPRLTVIDAPHLPAEVATTVSRAIAPSASP
jgi:hypothetical protein